MLNCSRTALTRFCCGAAFALVAAASGAIFAPSDWSPALRDGVAERWAARRTTESGGVGEERGDFNGLLGVKTANLGALGGAAPRETPSRRLVVERFRAEFDERLRRSAEEFWASRRSGVGSDVALRAVADGWARWGVGSSATARFLGLLTAPERAAFERRRREREPFDFASDRRASAASSRSAVATLSALKSENCGDWAIGEDGGVDAALSFLRSLDGASGDAGGALINNGGRRVARTEGGAEKEGGERGVDAALEREFADSFLWASSFDANPLNAVGAVSAADVVAVARSVESRPAEGARRALAASAFFFFFCSAFGGLGASGDFWGGALGGGASRGEREFWRRLDAAFFRTGVALKKAAIFLYFARLALFDAFRTWRVEDGVAAKAAVVRILASTRLLI